MDYVFCIAQLVWARATRAGEHAEELEAVHRMGNLYAWGEKVVAATAAAGFAAARERRRERRREREMERERIEVMRDWQRMGFMWRDNGNVVPSDLNAPTYAEQPEPGQSPEQEPEQGAWVRMLSTDHETGLGVWAWVRAQREETFVRPQSLLLSPRAEEREARDEEEEGPAEEGLLTEEGLLQVVMAGRDLVGWLLSEDGRRAVDDLWGSLGVMF